MAGISVPQALAIGIGAPIGTMLLAGLATKQGAKEYGRFFAIAGVATFAAAAAVQYFMPVPAAGAVQMAPRPMSVSSSWAQLGRYAGGINYPGQMTGAAGVDGSLIYID
jgi:hypothetical protein